ncbi:hypothetical protein FPZ12_008025 [Amycolatopsis acidicola]|uniref:Uncharacterized protein n=1 Tax=Amycolatopsis acidicola TaxID=2596893 RepID=A0A5N0VEB5_9PSEU|nr:hypothetical protein [Amycolatopsis acidicola]KAA9163968.1 hypothetical protein FPZ12_008025 [Amycolatopsis acidicola]
MTSPTKPGDWEPIIPVDEHKYVGLLDNESVYVGTFQSAEREVSPGNPIFLLPLLEVDFAIVRSRLRDRANSLNRDENYFYDRLPVRQLPKVAFLMESDYWAKLALGWVEQIGVGLYIEELRRLTNARWASQSTRHRARRMLKW